jgi:hypothetical protein
MHQERILRLEIQADMRLTFRDDRFWSIISKLAFLVPYSKSDSSVISTYPQSQRPDHIPDLSLGCHDRLVRLSVEQVKLQLRSGIFTYRTDLQFGTTLLLELSYFKLKIKSSGIRTL